MRRTIFELFAKSPFGPLQDHMTKVMDTAKLIPDLFKAFEEDDEKMFDELSKKIGHAEYEADIIKNEIRGDLPKTIFTPVARKDIVDILSFQDKISDVAEDVMVLLNMRKLPFPKTIRDELWGFIGQVMTTVEHFARISSELDELVEASFGGAEAGKVTEMIDALGREEHKADRMQHDLLKKLLALEDEFGALNIVLWMKVLGALGDIANNAERTGNRIRLFISK
ncbi:MAG: TIGR00153 family protein [Deltaproteobacteria bacterium]|nr:TIGR00153 family protein [Deltaproteobacteria bacterium]